MLGSLEMELTVMVSLNNSELMYKIKTAKKKYFSANTTIVVCLVPVSIKGIYSTILYKHLRFLIPSSTCRLLLFSANIVREWKLVCVCISRNYRQLAKEQLRMNRLNLVPDVSQGCGVLW